MLFFNLHYIFILRHKAHTINWTLLAKPVAIYNAPFFKVYEYTCIMFVPLSPLDAHLYL